MTRLATMALYKREHSLNTSDHESWAAWSHKMISAWKTLSAKLFARVLLDEVYEKMTVDTGTYLHYVTVRSSNISHEQITNLSVYTQMGIFQHGLEEIFAIKHSASKLARWAYVKVMFWSRGQI